MRGYEVQSSDCSAQSQPGNFHLRALSIGIRSQQLNKLCAFCLPHCASGRGYGIGRVWGDSLMCLPDKQIRLGSGTRASTAVFFFFPQPRLYPYSVGCVVEWLTPCGGAMGRSLLKTSGALRQPWRDSRRRWKRAGVCHAGVTQSRLHSPRYSLLTVIIFLPRRCAKPRRSSGGPRVA